MPIAAIGATAAKDCNVPRRAALQHEEGQLNGRNGPPLPLVFGNLQELSVVLAHLSGLFESARSLFVKASKIALYVCNVRFEVVANQIPELK